MVQWFCLVSWRLPWDIGSMLHQNWPHNKCSQLWPILQCSWFYHVSCTLFIMAELHTWAVEQWYWPDNVCRSVWPILYGTLILPWTLEHDGWMSYRDIGSVWHKDWLHIIYRSVWAIYGISVILANEKWDDTKYAWWMSFVVLGELLFLLDLPHI